MADDTKPPKVFPWNNPFNPALQRQGVQQKQLQKAPPTTVPGQQPTQNFGPSVGPDVQSAQPFNLQRMEADSDANVAQFDVSQQAPINQPVGMRGTPTPSPSAMKAPWQQQYEAQAQSFQQAQTQGIAKTTQVAQQVAGPGGGLPNDGTDKYRYVFDQNTGHWVAIPKMPIPQ